MRSGAYLGKVLFEKGKHNLEMFFVKDFLRLLHYWLGLDRLGSFN